MGELAIEAFSNVLRALKSEGHSVADVASTIAKATIFIYPQPSASEPPGISPTSRPARAVF
jgi:hypothetical protein